MESHSSEEGPEHVEEHWLEQVKHWFEDSSTNVLAGHYATQVPS